MLTDKLWEVSLNQDLHTPAAGNLLSTHSVPLSTARDIGQGNQLRFDVHITQAFTQSVASTLTINVIVVNGISGGNLGDASQRVIYQSFPFPTSELTLNRHLDIPIPTMTQLQGVGLPAANLVLNGHTVPAGSYIGLGYITTGNFTAGTVTSVLTAGGTAEHTPAYAGFNGFE